MQKKDQIVKTQAEASFMNELRDIAIMHLIWFDSTPLLP